MQSFLYIYLFHLNFPAFFAKTLGVLQLRISSTPASTDPSNFFLATAVIYKARLSRPNIHENVSGTRLRFRKRYPKKTFPKRFSFRETKFQEIFSRTIFVSSNNIQENVFKTKFRFREQYSRNFFLATARALQGSNIFFFLWRF